MKAIYLTLAGLFVATGMHLLPSHDRTEGVVRTTRPIEQPLSAEQLSAQDGLPIIPVTVEQIAYSIAQDKGWTEHEWQALVKLWGNESGWNTEAINPTSGACGIPQAWPCSKIGANWRDTRTQLQWGADYIAERYGKPSQALGFWYAQCGSDKGCWY